MKRRIAKIDTAMKRNLRAATVATACTLSVLCASVSMAHNLDQRDTLMAFDAESLSNINARAAAGQQLIQVGDVVGVILKSTPGPGTLTGVGGYFTFYIPEGSQVVGAEYLQQDASAPGGFIAIPMKGQSIIAIGDGAIGSATKTNLIGLALGPNINGVTELTVSSNGVHRGTIAGVYADTGIFYSFDTDTVWQSWASAGGYDRSLITTSDNTLVNNRGESIVPITKWDAEQLIGYGLSSPAAPVLDPDGRGNSPWGLANVVAGPESGYAWQFDRDVWQSTNLISNLTARMRAAVTNVGPWHRIQYPGSQISEDIAGLKSTALGFAGIDGSSVGWSLSTNNPLPPTISWTGTNSPKAVRFSFGMLELGRAEYARVKLKILSNPGTTNSSFDPDGCFLMYSDAFGGDAGGEQGGKDHLWRYYDPTIAQLNPCALIQKTASKSLVKPGESLYFTITLINTKTNPLTNVSIVDTVPAGLTFLSAVPAQNSGPNPLVWNYPMIAGNTSVSIRVNVQASALGTHFNTVTFSSDQALGSAQDSVLVFIKSLLRSEKSVSPETAAPGDYVNYTLTVYNDGTGPNGTPLVINEYLPTGFTYDSMISQEINGAPLPGAFLSVNSTNANQPKFTVSTAINPTNTLVLTFRVLISPSAPVDSYCNSYSLAFEGKVLSLPPQACVMVAGGQIGDTIFRDWNGNGSQDSGEEGMSGVTVRLYDSTGTNLLYTTVTDASGNYLFSGLGPETYVVTVPTPGSGGVPSGYTLTADPDGAAFNVSYTKILATDEVYLDADFGYQPGGAGSIGDQIFEDVGNDGAFNPPTDSGITNVTVYLYEDANGNGIINAGFDALITSTVVATNGTYSFPGLATGFSYLVYVDPNSASLSNYFVNLYGPGATFTASTPNPASVTNLVGAYIDADIGFWRVDPGSIGDQVFVDDDHDGIYDFGSESPLAGVTVNLFRTNELIATTVSDASGAYLFTDLGPGSYSVIVDTSSSGVPTGYFASVSSYDVTLTAGQSFLTADFPFTAGLVKTSEKTFAQPGETNTYSLKPFFPGTELLTAVRVFDPIPTGTTYLVGSANAGGTFGGYTSIAAVPGADTGLTNSIAINRNFVNIGGSIVVTMNVRTATFATNVSPVDFSVVGGAYTILSGPTPATQNVSTAAGGSNFVWTIRLDGAGEYIINSGAEDAAGSLTWPVASSPSILSMPYGGTNVVAWNLGTNMAGVVGEIISSGFTPGIYALRGNDTTNASKYSVDGGFWSTILGIPATVKEGGALASSGTGVIYALRGDKTQAFYSYNVQSNSWTARANTGVNVDKGGALVYLPSNAVPYAYAFMGNSTGFRRYNIVSNTWTVMAVTPATVKEGGSLTTDGTNIFATFGNSAGGDRRRFYRYNQASNTWTQLANFPIDAGWGTAITRLGGYIFALGGNNGTTFHRYDIAANTWSNMATTPAAVRQGGAITTDGINLFALRGNTLADFWQYTVSNNTWTTLSAANFGTVKEGGSLAFHDGLNPQGRTIEMSASPTLVSTGDVITIVMQLASDVDVTNVVPSNLVVTATGGATATLLTGPLPASNNVSSNGVTEFTWTYRANPGTNAGSLTFIGTAQGGATVFPTGTANSVIVSPILTFRVTINTGAPPVIVNEGMMTEQGGSMDPILSNPTELSTAGSIGDRVWEDLDGDGVQDTNEVGLANIEVCAYQSNGTTLVSCALTDIDGIYHIYGLTSATYVVKTSPGTFPTGYVPTTPSSLTIPLAANEQYTNADFGLEGPGTSTIGDTVWLDADENGLFDGSDTPLTNVALTLYLDVNSNNVVDGGDFTVGSTTTDTNGLYLFTGLNDGNYLVLVDTNSASLAGKSLVSGTNPHVVALGTAENYLDADFGFNWDGSIGDTVFYDFNANGVQDPGEGGATNSVVDLFTDDDCDGEIDIGVDVLLFSVVTDVNGNYQFSNLAPTCYVVSAEEQTVPAPTNSAEAGQLGRMTATAGTHRPVTLGAGETYTNADFGFIEGAVIEGLVFYDINHNGFADVGEPGLSNVLVTLTGIDINSNIVNRSTNTTVDGEYSFVVVPGTYTIFYDYGDADIPAGLTDQTTPTSIVVIVSFGDESENNNFGLDNSGVIGDTVFVDVDSSGGQDVGEPGLSGVALVLYQDSNTNGVLDVGDIALDTTVTVGGGFYEFLGLADGDYLVEVQTNSIPPGYSLIPTADPTGALDGVGAATIVGGNSVLTIDFGYPPIITVYSVSGTVFYDANTNGVLDAEAGLSNVTVNVAIDTDNDGTNDLFFSVPSGTNGDYLVSGIPSNSTVTITVDTNTLPNSAYVATTTNTLIVANISADTGDQDFGFVETLGSISGTVVAFANGNGIAEPGEVPLPGVYVILTYAGSDGILGNTNDVITTNITDSVGGYLFTNLLPGVYQVVKVTPAGYTDLADADGGNPNSIDVNLPIGQNATQQDFEVTAITGFTLDKSVTSPTGRPAVVGESVIYTITLVNTGELALGTVQFDDTFDTNFLQFVSAAPPESSLSGGSITWSNLGPVPASGSISVTANFTAVQSTLPGDTTNSVVATASTTNDIPLPPQTSSVPETLVAPSYVLEKVLATPTGGVAEVGGTVTFLISFTNTGDVALDAVRIEDTFDTNYLAFTASTPSPDDVQAGQLVWSNLGPVAVGGSFVVTADFTAVQANWPGSTTNAATSIITQTNGLPVPSQTNTASVQIATPAISVTKTAGNAADGDVLYVTNGTDVIYTYVVVNEGDTYLSNITVTDNVLGVVGVIAGPVAPGETNILFATNLNVTADVTNVADATGTPTDDQGTSLGLNDVTDTDDAETDVVDPALSVTKTAGNAADGDVWYITTGTDVVYTYVVVNEGDTYLSNITVTDNVLGVIGVIAGPVAPGETNILFATNLNVTADVTNVADATGTPTDSGGASLGVNDVTDTDDAETDVVDPAISVIKTAGNAADGDTLFVTNGTDVVYTYVVVNEGDTYLSNITVTDNVLGVIGVIAGPVAPGETNILFATNLNVTADVTNVADATGTPTDDSGTSLNLPDVADTDDAETDMVGPAVSVTKTAGSAADGEIWYVTSGTDVIYTYVVVNEGNTYLSNITVTDNVLGVVGVIAGPVAPGETNILFATNLNVTADVTNIADATGTPTDSGGTSLNLPDVTDTDDAETDVVDPQLSVIKTAGSAADGEIWYVTNGTDVIYTYVVVNEGDTYLSNITVTDNVLGVIGVITGPVAPGETNILFATNLNVTADVTNVADAMGTPTDSGGASLGVNDVMDTDDAETDVVDPAISVIKTAGNAADGDTLFVTSGTDVTYTYVVVNEGDTYLSDIVVTDNVLGVIGIITGPVAPGETNVLTATNLNVTADITNIVEASGSPTDDGGASLNLPDVSATDDAVVDVVNPALSVVKTAGNAADGATLSITSGDDVVYTYEVVNIGDTYLSDIVVTDDVLGVIGNITGPVAPGETNTLVETNLNVTADVTNIVTVSGTPTDGGGTSLGINDVGDTDDAVVDVVGPSILVIKTAGNAADGNTLFVTNGEDVVYTYQVINTGDSYLSGIVVTDDVLGVIGTITGPVAPGETNTLFATNLNVTANVTNTVLVTATPTDSGGVSLNLPDVTDTDDAVVELSGSIGDFVWFDLNKNGIQDGGSETGVADVVVTLYDATTNVIGVTTTDVNGAYAFIGVVPGSYFIGFETNSFPAGFVLTLQTQGTNTLVDSDPDPITGLTAPFSLVSGQSELSVDAGLACEGIILSCPSDQQVECSADTSTNAMGVATATSPCSCVINVDFSDDIQGGCGNSFVLTRVWTATDECGNSAVCTQIITAVDATLPEITCPEPVTVQCIADVPAPDTNTASATDNCSIPGVSHVGDSSETNGCVITITRTYRATDDCGNTADCTQQIIVSDTTPPQITCPATATVQCIGDVPAVDTNAVTATDNCTTNPAISHVGDSPETNGCVITITRTYRATDACGNTADCTQDIIVSDSTPPSITCPAPATVECLGDVPAVDTNAVSASDNCSIPSVSHVGDSPQTNGCVITITRTYRATDACGNTADCTQDITVSDSTPPTVTCPSATTVQCIGDVPAPNTNLVTATDNCTTNPAKTFVSDAPVTNGCVITITRTYRATDACGNSTTCTQTITVQDTIPPAITCPSITTVQCIGDVPAPNTNLVTATDNCTTNPAKTFVSDAPVTNGCVITITRTYRATDACGNSTTCTQTISVSDTIPPAITCPATATVQCIGDVPAADTNAVSASDNCSTPSKTFIGDSALTNGCVITITRTYRATDACGNTADCTQDIIVSDSTPPTITCPAPVTVQCLADVPAANTNAVQASDNCSAVGIVHVGDSSATSLCGGAITRTYRATDACGNSSTCTQTITINDTTPPQITCPAPTTVQCVGNVPAPNTNAVTATDNCTTNPAKAFVSDAPVTNGCVITITRTYRATDGCGNSTTCTQTITVSDTTPPQITCPGPVTVQCIGDVSAPNTNAVTATDNCTTNPAKTFVSDAPVTNGCVITITRTYRATDACGNSTTCTQTITVSDTTPPTISCPATATVQCIGDVPAANTNSVIASDNCSAVSKTHVGDSALTNGCVITITRTYRATDACGNTTDCTQDIIVSDSIPPTITCPAPTTVQCLGDVPAANTNAVQASDNCSAVGIVHVGDSSATSLCGGAITRTYRATDACGNSSTCTQTITINDTTPPQITCPAPATVQCIGNVPAPNTNLVTATDNCTTNPAKTFVSDAPVTNGCVITITRTYRATDACGNSTTCTQTITVQDTIPPTVTCPAATTVQCIGNVPAPNTNLVTATDNCTTNPAKTFVSDSPVTNGCVITITRTYRATDACGNSTTCTQTITVQDTIPPTISCPGPTSVQCIGDVPSPNTNLVTAADNCTTNPAKTFVSDAPVTNGCVITITRTYRATDACGNSATCTQTITVSDTIPPIISCPPPVFVQCLGDVPAPNTNEVFASDNCAIATLVHAGDSMLTNGCVITVSRTYRATDGCSNSASCVQFITVSDSLPPTITCPTGPIIVNGDGNCHAQVPDLTPQASDNCDTNLTIVQYPQAGTTFTSMVTVVIFAVDDCGNSTSCQVDLQTYGGAIGSEVWEDDQAAGNGVGISGNGKPDENLIHAGRNGITVTLTYVFNGSTNVLSTVTTNGPGGIRGYYLFTNLPPSTYLVQVDTSTVPVSPYPLIPRIFTTLTNYTVTLAQCEQSLTNDFGFMFVKPSAVELKSFDAQRTTEGVAVRWTTAVELENLGFNIYRSGQVNGERVKVNGSMIEGQGSDVGQDYQLIDAEAQDGTTYYYWLEDVDWNMTSTIHGPAIVNGDSTPDQALAGFVASDPGLYRISYEALKAAGVAIDGIEPSTLEVFVSGRQVASYVNANGAVMKAGDSILFYLADSESQEIAIRTGSDALRMEEIYAAPLEDEGSTWYDVAPQSGMLWFDTRPDCVRYLLTGFEDAVVSVLDITDTDRPKLLFGYAWLNLADETGLYLSYPTAQPARCVAIESWTIRDVHSLSVP